MTERSKIRPEPPYRRHASIVVILALGMVACDSLGANAGIERSAELLDAALMHESETPPAPIVTRGLDSTYTAGAIAAAAELPRLRCLLIARHGEIQSEQCFRGPGLDSYANVKSVSKSVLSAVVGIAIAEGHLQGPGQPILPFFSRYLSPEAAEERSSITVGHLLTMQSGLERTSGAYYGAWVQSPDWVRYAITRPMTARPGDERLYSTGNTHLLSAILTQATGRSTWEYAREKLAEPMGIQLPRWLADPQGIYFGGNEMLLKPRDMVRFGELYRNGGRIDGKQILPESWIEESLASRSSSRTARSGYGYGWFLGTVNGHPMFYASGYGGQFIFVVPDLELTVVTTSHPDDPRTNGHNQAIQRILRDYIVPAAEMGAWSDTNTAA